MRVLYLFNRVRVGILEKIAHDQDHDGHFFGMLRLKRYDIEADYIELEKFWPLWFTRFLRERILNIHYIHLPLFLKMMKYDIVFSSTAFGSLFLKVILRLKRPYWVIFDYGLNGMIGNCKTFKQKALHFMINKVDGIITISPGERDAILKLSPNLLGRVEFMHLGVDIKFFKPDKSIIEENFIISPGRDPGRDIVTLAESTKGLNIIEVKVTTGPRNFAKINSSFSHVRRYDFSPTELRHQYSLAKLVVIPLDIRGGLNDAMGCSTLVEAMAMGKAIIATSTETMSTYITHGVNGWLVPYNDIKALKEAIIKLLSDESLRQSLGRSAREFIMANCTADVFASRLAVFFKQIK